MILAQQDYWAILQDCTPMDATDEFDITWNYPQALGQGYWREIQLREGLTLAIAQYQLHVPITIQLPEREHPLELSFYLSGGFQDQVQSIGAGQYALYGSGTAPNETFEECATEEILAVNVHIDSELFTAYWNPESATLPATLQTLIQPASQFYDMRCGQITPAMQTALQQILHCPCPFAGVTKRIYLESKVWELVALLLSQPAKQEPDQCSTPELKPDDIERIHQARDILLQHLDSPPSLIELARQVGLNDCTLKRGFRQVFRKTAFGYLHDYRLEQARQLLAARQLNISEIAQTIGFASRSYFAAAFRKKFGVTPRAYLTQSKNSV